MLTYRRAAPDQRLMPVLRHFSQRQCIDAHRHVRPFALPARTEQFIEFYLGDVYRISTGDGQPADVPRIALVGPHRAPGKRLHMVGDVDNFTVHFTATGFHRLFGHPLSELCDLAVHAGDLLKARIWPWYDALQTAVTFEERVSASTAFLGRVLEAARAEDSIDRAAQEIVARHGGANIRSLAQCAGWSERHLNRSLTQRTGLPPKLYSRLSRFHALLTERGRSPAATMSRLALEAGYCDQAHFIRDCQEFTGATPRVFLAGWAESQPDLA